MVIDDDGDEAQFGGVGQRIMGHDAAIERHQKLRTLIFQAG